MSKLTKDLKYCIPTKASLQVHIEFTWLWGERDLDLIMKLDYFYGGTKKRTGRAAHLCARSKYCT